MSTSNDENFNFCNKYENLPYDKDTTILTFIHTSQVDELKKNHKNWDNISTCDIIRRSMLITSLYSERFLTNVTKGYMLQNDLKRYAQVIDNKTGVNNFSSYLDIVPRNTSTNNRWTSTFDTSKDFTSHFIKEIECDCFTTTLKENDLNMLFIKKRSEVELNSKFEFKKNLEENIDTSVPSDDKNIFSEFRTAANHILKSHNKNSSDDKKPNCEKSAPRTVVNKFVPPSKNVEPAKPETNGVDEELLKHFEPKLVDMIKTEIMDCKNNLKWEDIAGLEYAKAAIQEIVVWPMLRPDLFTGLRQPPKGILLFGPPGTGKTLIGKCVASQAKATFFSISASSITSKYVGEGEKMVRALFAVSRCYQPSIIFIDEIDSLLSQRSDSEHESSRRIKTEFLVQLDGVATGQEDRIVIMGATNRPQELDGAALRRLVKRLYIPLPDQNARYQMIYRKLGTMNNDLTEVEINEIASLTDGYSGADITNLCTEASLEPIRCIDMSLIQTIQCTQVRPISIDDFKTALRNIRSSVPASDLEQYLAWNEKYGSGLRQNSHLVQ